MTSIRLFGLLNKHLYQGAVTSLTSALLYVNAYTSVGNGAPEYCTRRSLPGSQCVGTAPTMRSHGRTDHGSIAEMTAACDVLGQTFWLASERLMRDRHWQSGTSLLDVREFSSI